MELTYTVRGTDGKQYGPVNLEQLSGWAREGRISATVEVQRSDMEHWSKVGDFAELKSFLPATAAAPVMAAAPATISATPATGAQTSPQLRSGASWFYWVAALSLVNSIVAFTGSDWRFLLGLGITQLIDAVASEVSGGGRIIALVLDLVVAGIFVLFGVFAHKRHTWAFVTGMVLFALDGVIFGLAGDWLGVGFHVFVLFRLFMGFKACRELNAN
jgi:hypothetical protein